METLSTGHRVKVQAGTYFLGDPCYAVPQDLWMPLLESCNVYQGEAVGTVSAPSGFFEVLAFGTAYGDGRYSDNKGNSYPVDAGLIGLTPVGLINESSTVMNENGTKRHDLGTFVTFDRDIICSAEGGIMDFGDYHIDTKNEDKDEEDSCIDCGSENDQCHDSQCSACCDACDEGEWED